MADAGLHLRGVARPVVDRGALFSDNAGLNLNWAGQVARQVRAGVPYPRWLSESFGGLGSSNFYFYPPLPFWIDALVSLVTLDLARSWRFAVTAAVVLWLSGLAMHRWLMAETGRPVPALPGAVLYMVAPYHLVDHYMRGVFAEFTAIAVLPVALLASVTLLPACTLWRVRRPAAIARGLLGFALAALHIVPALSLQRWISADWL